MYNIVYIRGLWQYYSGKYPVCSARQYFCVGAVGGGRAAGIGGSREERDDNADRYEKVA